jgi:hypothetical protein
MKKLILIFALGVSSAAFACDCQKNKQQASACSCGAQSCPGECNHDAPPPDPPKRKKAKKS